ncbi:caspase Dronc [Drosophila grimshawi]|uniref:GH16053 n=1 Tax=Drosophila grimshawi TaxID=7222 RepID=B4J2U2_DROGR|nr:caspase Dronc [Drosophila grimshawi]EDV96083.1 GH16053 [Drosophila grimshawi]
MAEERVEEREYELGMLERHRNHILKNMEKLIEYTDYDVLVTETVRRGLITPKMQSILENLEGREFNMTADQVRLEQHRNYFTKIRTRGPTAYAELKAILNSLGYLKAVQLLEQVDPQDNELSYVSLRRNHNSNNNNCNKSADIVDTRICDLPANEQRPSVSHQQIVIEPNSVKEQLTHSDAKKPLTPFTEPITGQKHVVKLSDRIHRSDQDTYAMESEHNRGVLFIVNIVDFPNLKNRRNGADNDGAALIHIFRQIGFTVFSYVNLDQEEFFEKLKTLISSNDVRDTECFVLVLMTHGERVNEVDHVRFTDDSVCKVRKIINEFQSDKCPNLIDKPKVLMFPFCRGDQPDKGKIIKRPETPLSIKEPCKSTQTDGVPFANVPTLSDILICYASTPGYETHRDVVEGSWYIQCFCYCMAEHAHNTSIEEILRKTQKELSKMRTGKNHLQTAVYENHGFSKHLYFNPGFPRK